MNFELQNNKLPNFSDEDRIRFGLDTMGAFDEINRGVIRYEDLVSTLVSDGWLSVEKMDKFLEYNDLTELPSFIRRVAGLSVEASGRELSQDELSNIKSNVGLISLEHLLEELKNKELHGA